MSNKGFRNGLKKAKMATLRFLSDYDFISKMAEDGRTKRHIVDLINII